jgi:hypothetical protein
MKKLIRQLPDYSLWQIDKDYLFEVSHFVVKTNYMHHQGYLPSSIEEEIMEVYNEEIKYFPESFFYIVTDNLTQQIIGSIRIFRWDKKSMLPIEKKYNVNITAILKEQEQKFNHIFHIGRFAVSTKDIGRASILLFKTLLANVFYRACSLGNSIILAESDKKLFEKFRLLDIHFSQAGQSKIELGSETIPVYITSHKLSTFLEKHKHLCYV